MNAISNVKPPEPLAPPPATGAAVPAPAPAAEPAWGSVLDALKEKDATLDTLLTGVANQPNAQTAVQVRTTIEESRALGELVMSREKAQKDEALKILSQMV